MFDRQQQERLGKAQTMCKHMVTKAAPQNKWRTSSKQKRTDFASRQAIPNQGLFYAALETTPGCIDIHYGRSKSIRPREVSDGFECDGLPV